MIPAPDGAASGRAHEDLGAYVLGGLPAIERTAFESHLAGCADCRSELRASLGLLHLLSAVPVADANALAAAPSRDGLPATADASGGTAVPELLARLSRVRRGARRRRAGLVAALAAACLAVGVLVAPLVVPQEAPDANYALNSADGVRAEIALERKAWGTELHLTAASLPTEGTLSLWVVDHEGMEERAGRWAATDSGRSSIVGAVPLQAGGIAEIEVRNNDNRVLALVALPPGASDS